MGESDPDVLEMIAEAVDAAAGSVEDIAKEMGVSPHTIWAWLRGDRNPKPANLKKLASVLDRRGGKLHDLADRLREAAES